MPYVYQWAQWGSLGDSFVGGPGAVLQTRGRLVAFARGTDNAIWHRWQVTTNGEWSGWESLGGGLTSDPDAALNAPGGLVVFARGTDSAIWHRWQDRVYVPDEPTTKVVQTWLYRYSTNRFRYRGTTIGEGEGWMISTVKNIAMNVNDQVAVPLSVSYRSTQGESMGPVSLQPGAATRAFEGLNAAGDWTVSAVNISAALLRDTIAIEIAIRRP